MTEEELLAEEYICNGKCQDDITRNYVHCKTCTRLKDFLAGYKAGKAELEKENAELKHQLAHRNCLDCSNHSSNLRMRNLELEKENAELRKVAEFQQSSNMSRHFENKQLKEGLAVGSTFNKALNSMNKNLEEEKDKYRNMVFDKDDQLTKAKEILKKLKALYLSPVVTKDDVKRQDEILEEAEQFIKEIKEND